MAVTLIGGGRPNAITLNNFGQIWGNLGSTVVPEASRQILVGVAGTLAKWTLSVDANGTGRSMTSRKNGVTGGISVSPTNSTAGSYQDLTNTLHFAVADLMDVFFAGVAPAFTPFGFICTYTGDAGVTAGLYAGNHGQVTVNPGFTALGGQLWQATEVVSQARIRAPGILQYFFVGVETNTSANSTTVISRKNGANGNCSITFSAGTTGQFQDIVHTDTLASGDLYGFQVSGVTVASSVSCGPGCTSFCTTDASEVLGSSPQLGLTTSPQFIPVFYQQATTAQTVETNVQLPMSVACTLSNFRTLMFLNTLAAPLTMRVRKNATNGNQSLTIGAGVTGQFEDTTNTDVFTATDLVDYSLASTSASVFSTSTIITMTPANNMVFPNAEAYPALSRRNSVVSY